jgi:hypothetical protein
MRNPFRLLVMGSIFSVCLLSLFIPAHATEGSPAAVVEKDSFDFGNRFEGIEVVHDFIIKNKGDADLEIYSVSSG